MSTADAPHLIDPEFIGAGDRIVPGRIDDRRFALCVLVAVTLHAALLINVNSGAPKRLGAAGGADDAISVSIVTERDLKGQATVEDRAAGPLRPTMPPPAPAPAKQPAPPAAEPVPPPTETPADAATTTARSAAPEQARATEPADTPGPKPKTEAKATTEDPATTRDATRETNKRPAPAAKPAAPRKPAPPEKTETAKLTPPAIFQAPTGGGGAGVQRPAGITRSGENDDFARGVIRALQTTMPQLRNTFGRVTVRITLDMKGDLVGTVVIKPSNVAGLDQSVVFATRQSSFPFPPRNAVPADLVFFVTYIYR